MAPVAAATVPYSAVTPLKQTISVKALAESGAVTSIPSSYYTHNEPAALEKEKDPFPIIDFSLLTSTDPDQRSKAIQDLGKAAQDWGFFMLVNHGVPESLMKELVAGCQKFFDLPQEEKREYLGKDIWNPIRTSTGIDVKVEKAACWRDFLKTFVHPEFHFPYVPTGFREIAREYNKRTREIVVELLKGISQHSGFEENYIYKETNFESGFQVCASNLYPPCPHPELAMGIPAHTDHGLITLLIQNGVGGLQIQHNGDWFNVDPLPNAFLVNTGDHLEVLSNGKYKSVWHRAVVNSKTTRMSIAVAHGPALDKVVGPAPELVDGQSRPPAYRPLMYKEYMELQQLGKNGLEFVRL